MSSRARGDLGDLARAAATLLRRDDRRRWRMDQRFGADLVRDQVGVLAQPVADPFDLNHHARR